MLIEAVGGNKSQSGKLLTNKNRRTKQSPGEYPMVLSVVLVNKVTKTEMIGRRQSRTFQRQT